MPITLEYKSQFHLSQHIRLLYPTGESITALQNTNFAPKSSIFPSSSSLSHKILIQKPIICAKKKRTQSGSRKLTRFIRESLPIIASNLKCLPQPLGLVVAELIGGDGGGHGFLKGFGGERGFGWWRRGKMKNSGFFVVFVVACYLVGLYFGIELTTDVFSWWVLCIGLFFGFVLMKEFKRKVKDLVLGLFWFGVLVCLGSRREDLQKWVKRFAVSSPVVGIERRSKRKKW